jgi:hypothetical protein
MRVTPPKKIEPSGPNTGAVWTSPSMPTVNDHCSMPFWSKAWSLLSRAPM